MNPSLFDVLTSLAKVKLESLVKVKLGLVYMDKSVAIWCFNKFNDKDNLILFIFKEFEKVQKENSISSFS